VVARRRSVKEHYLLIYESPEPIPLQTTDVTYRIGPYKSYEEADDAFFIASYHVKPEFDEIGREVFWDYDIETEGEDDVTCSC
jgi:hypothetical protein